MPWGFAAGALGSVAGAAVSSAMAPSVSGGTNGSGGYYVPTGLSYGDQTWQQLLGQELGAQGNINATAQGYGPNYQTNANNAAAGYDWLGQSLLPQQSQAAYGTQNALLNAGQQVFNMGLDPQSALYNQTLNNITQQTGATNSMYGLGSSAAGAGVQNQAVNNFNIDWQNTQLSRALQGLQGYTGAASEAGQYGQYGTALAEAAPGYQLTAGQIPYSTGMTIAGAPLTSAQSIQSNIIPYLNNGNGAQTVPYQQGNTNAQSLGSSLASGIGGLGTAYQNAGSLGNLFSGTTGSFGGGDFSGAFTSSPYYSGGGNSYGFTLQ